MFALLLNLTATTGNGNVAFTVSALDGGGNVINNATVDTALNAQSYCWSGAGTSPAPTSQAPTYDTSPSFSGGVDAVTSVLADAGVDLKGVSLRDSSGLSVDDRLTATTLDEVVALAAGPDEPKLRPLVDLLPVAGGSGTLSDRFLDPETSQGAAGWLRAKTGSLTATNALAGIVTDRGGRVLTCALISNGAGQTGRTAIDALAATLRTCGCGA